MSNPLWSINSQRSPDKQHNFDPQMLSSKITAFSLEFYYRIHKTGFELWVPKQFPDFKYLSPDITKLGMRSLSKVRIE